MALTLDIAAAVAKGRDIAKTWDEAEVYSPTSRDSITGGN